MQQKKDHTALSNTFYHFMKMYLGPALDSFYISVLGLFDEESFKDE